MIYIIQLNKDKDIIDLCYATKDIGKVISTEKTTIGLVKQYIEKEIKNMPLNGCKLRLLDIKEILESGKNG